MKIRIDKADQAFSQYVRLRDMECRRCHSPVRLNDKGLPVSHTMSHYFGRAKESVRFDPENGDTLCMPCHRIWASDDRETYREFKIKQLGQKGYDALCIRANNYAKKDRKMAYLVCKQLLKEVQSGQAREN